MAQTFTPILARKVDPEKWSLGKTSLDYFKNRSVEVCYDGVANPVLQLGTRKDPVRAPFGLSRWENSTKKYKKVQSQDDTDWVEIKTGADGKPSKKKPSGKFEGSLVLNRFETEGTQDYYTYQTFDNLVEFVIKRMMDESQGLFDFPVSEQLARKMFNSRPLRKDKDINEKTGKPYAPDVKFKVGWNLSTQPKSVDPTTGIISGGAPYLNVFVNIVDGQTKTMAEDPFPLLTRGQGIWMIQVNNLTVKDTEVFLTLGLVKAKLWEITRTNDAEFADDSEDESASTSSTSGNEQGAYGDAQGGGYGDA